MQIQKKNSIPVGLNVRLIKAFQSLDFYYYIIT